MKHLFKYLMMILRACPLLFAILAILCMNTTNVQAQITHRVRPYTVQHDIEYASTDRTQLLLDLYMPSGVEKPPLVLWVHGGAWRSGSKDDVDIKYLLRSGFAIASIEYRLSIVAPFPAMVHDCKAAIRFLRANESTYQYNSTKIGIAGSSAGGHLVALIGVTNGHSELEGSLGDHLEQSSNVQAIVDLYGPTNFLTILPQSTPHGLGVRIPALQLLLEDQPENVPELAELASPVFHVDVDDPPVLIIHGDQDLQVPINQSHELQAKYEEYGLDVTFEVVHGGGHGGDGFDDLARRQIVTDFLRRTLGTNDPK